jgi:hypothetical protein
MGRAGNGVWTGHEGRFDIKAQLHYTYTLFLDN